MNNMKRIMVSFLMGFSGMVFGQSMEVVAPPVASGNGLNPGQPGSICQACKLRIELQASCYGTNLRSVSNPIAPNAEVKMKLKFKGRPEIVVSFNSAVTRKTLTRAEINALPAPKTTVGGTAEALAPTIDPGFIQVQIPGFELPYENNKPLTHEYLQFEQDVGTEYGQFYAKDGPLTNVGQTIAVQANNKVVISASFPGQEGYCGGYHSPLMVFFDDQRPLFNAKSDFPINGKSQLRNWPEAGSPGFFLVAKKKGVKTISGRQDLSLFEGGSLGFSNGFVMLKDQFDSNKDGFISKEDKEFDRLYLWKDADGMGNPKEKDLVKLASQGVSKIDLKYSLDKVVPIANRAEERERSSFSFTDKKTGKNKTGTVIDMWFTSIE
jgi:hypothetical protein